jgi:hypothetical protein
MEKSHFSMEEISAKLQLNKLKKRKTYNHNKKYYKKFLVNSNLLSFLILLLKILKQKIPVQNVKILCN